MNAKHLLKEFLLTSLIVGTLGAVFPPIIVMAAMTGVACFVVRNF